MNLKNPLSEFAQRRAAKKLGSGGFSIVWECEDPTNFERFAVKSRIAHGLLDEEKTKIEAHKQLTKTIPDSIVKLYDAVYL